MAIVSIGATSPERVINLQEHRRVLPTLLSVVRLSLGNRPRHRYIIQIEPIKRDILAMPIPATATIRRVAFTQPSPGLQIRAERRMVGCDIPRHEVLHNADLSGVLAYAAQGDSLAIVESAVGDVDVGGVLFECDGVVAVVDGPAEEGYVVGV